MKNIDILNLYEERGFCVVDFDDMAPLLEAQSMLNSKLKELTKNPDIILETYHKFVPDSNHEEMQWKLSNFFWENDLCRFIAIKQIDLLQKFIGYDILIQKKPFLRIARPEKKSDNIGYHRDTLYGQSPFEVAVHSPLVSLNEKSCLKFSPCSHVDPESKYDIEEASNVNVSKGSKKHEMGHPYAPKNPKIEEKVMVPLPLNLGQAVIFPPSTLHGQVVNLGQNTRFSFDFRIVSPYAPINIRKDFSSRGYAELSKSAVTKVADKYHEANNM